MLIQKNLPSIFPVAGIILLICSACCNFVCNQTLYEDFLTKNSRNFQEQKLLSDYKTRYSVFCHNREYVETINSQKLSYTLDIYWKNMDKTDQERAKIVNLGFNPEEIAATAQTFDFEGLKKVAGIPPASVDWRTSQDVSSIKDQGKCGACWAFTTVGLYQSWMMVKGEAQYDLSEEYILECTTKYTYNVLHQNYDSNCDGGYLNYAGDLARVNGIPLESKFPYKGLLHVGAKPPTTDGICYANQSIVYGGNPNEITLNIYKKLSHDNMKQLIAAGPVGALIYANTGFQAYKSGVYSGCPLSQSTSYSKVNHAVVIIGYDVNGNYIVKNSWGTKWGTNGFGVVSKDIDCALSVLTFTYSSNAAPGANLVYTNLINFNTYKSGTKIQRLLFAIFIAFLGLII